MHAVWRGGAWLAASAPPQLRELLARILRLRGVEPEGERALEVRDRALLLAHGGEVTGALVAEVPARGLELDGAVEVLDAPGVLPQVADHGALVPGVRTIRRELDGLAELGHGVVELLCLGEGHGAVDAQ